VPVEIRVAEDQTGGANVGEEATNPKMLKPSFGSLGGVNQFRSE
jgi:hypothetical protein